jgi:phosphoribosylformylglycinamidine (FGAM) synthase PurS component
MKIDVAIELIIPDNTAFTVLTALRQMGAEGLAAVERSEQFILTVDDGAQAGDMVRQLARAEVVFNPNKHRMSFCVEGKTTAIAPPQFEAFVRDRDEDNSRLLTLLTGTFGMRALRGLERSVGWRLFDTQGPASRERLEWACRELLANAVSQQYDIRPRPVRTSVREPATALAKEGR